MPITILDIVSTEPTTIPDGPVTGLRADCPNCRRRLTHQVRIAGVEFCDRNCAAQYWPKLYKWGVNKIEKSLQIKKALRGNEKV